MKMPFKLLAVYVILLLLLGLVYGQKEEDYESITSDDCTMCHEKSKHETDFREDLSASIHDGFDCLDCHADKDTSPHREDPAFRVESEACRTCHEEASEDYKAHGHEDIDKCIDIPCCSDCHGDHDILPSDVKLSKTHPLNLPQTCGKCHEDIDLTRKWHILVDKPVEIYESSVHGMATKEGFYGAATCNDCHSTKETAHKIYSPANLESSINHYNVPDTCGKCHAEVTKDFWEGIHGQLVTRGYAESPVCTHCHGEHGILPTKDPRSPVSSVRLAEATCSPCHESVILNERYGRAPGSSASFIDSYHGLKTKAGDTHVANCASCHGVHKILPSTDPSSTIHSSNLQTTCGDCHPGISEQLAMAPIHGASGQELRSPIADIVEKIYILAIIVIIGSMIVHWLIDLGRAIHKVLIQRPQIQRMRINEVWQHTCLMVTFIVLVISGFALRFEESWFAKFFFGWEGGFEMRGLIHRISAVLFIITTTWHLLYIIFSPRGRMLFWEMWPKWKDFTDFLQRILYNLGLRKTSPSFGRFSYVEKAEYWALVWGTVIMVVTGFMLWFDNWFIQYWPKAALDVALVVHYWEAWLATLAIVIWHLYSTVFSPHVYPMNPSWITGNMPEDMYRHEHPDHLEEAKQEGQEKIWGDIKKYSPERNSNKYEKDS
jgi:cytochrome b subunit of formate dehydrogenase